MMRKVLLLLLLSLLVACQDKGRIVEPKDGPAHVLIENNEFNFGVVKDTDGILERQFLIVNDGGESLVIDSVDVGCHCTQVDFPKHSIKPGHGAAFTVKLDVRSLSQGSFSRTIDIYPKDGDMVVVFVVGDKI